MSKGKSLVHLKTEKENQGQLENEGQKEFLDTKYKRANEFCVQEKEWKRERERMYKLG